MNEAFTIEQSAAVAQALIDQAMSVMGVDRRLAIMALGIRDMKRIQNGMETQIEGVNFQTDFAHEHTDSEIHEDDLTKIVGFLESVDPVEAKH